MRTSFVRKVRTRSCNTSVALRLAVGLIIVVVSTSAWAQVANLKITEVNYNPVGSDANFEHFEVTNFGAAAYTGECSLSGSNLAADRFIEKVGGTDTSHILCLQASPATFTIQPGEAVIFARREPNFIAEFSPPTGCQVFDYGNSVALNNNGDIIRILDSFQGTVLASMSYDGSIANGNGNSLQLDLGTETYFEAPPTICSFEVSIDIKPGSDPNSINPRKKGVVPVAILGSANFDAAQVDVTTIAFGPAGATPAHDGHVEDVNTDGFSDFVVHFKAADTGIVCGDTEATLTGETFGGASFMGTDAVKTAGCK